MCFMPEYPAMFYKVVLFLLWISCPSDSRTDVLNETLKVSLRRVHEDLSKNTSHVNQLSTKVVHLLTLLGWRTVTVMCDHQHHSREMVDTIMYSTSVSQGIRFLHYETEPYLERDELQPLLQSLHEHLFPTLNFLLIGRPRFVLNMMAQVASHDALFKRSTDFRDSSRWLILTLVSQDLLQNLQHTVDGHLDHLSLMSNSEHINGNFTSIKTWSRSIKPPTFLAVNNSQLSGSQSTRSKLEDIVFPNIKYGFNGRTLLVSSLMYAPFTIARTVGDQVVHEGYCFELLNIIAQALNFSVQLVTPPDGEWGLEHDGIWTGLVGQLQFRNVDMVVAPLSMHEDRAEVMDFILPAFHIENVDILCRHQQGNQTDTTVLLKPYKYKVLICIAAVVAVTVVLIVVLEQWTPRKEISVTRRIATTRNQCFCQVSPRVVLVNINETFWSIFGTIFKQGVLWNPVSTTRVLMTSWWLLTLVLGAGYSAYLVASLAVHAQTKPFRTLQDVVDSQDFKLGIMSTGVIKLIFQKSKRDDFKQAFAKVVKLNQTDPDVFAGSESAHVRKVLSGKYCWIVDVTTAQKTLQLSCDLDTVGLRLNQQQLTIGVPLNSPFKKTLEETMSSLADSGLFDKWWRRWQKQRSPEMCPRPPPIYTLSIRVLIGPVSLAAVGVGAAGIVLVFEIVKHRTCRHMVVSERDRQSTIVHTRGLRST